MSRVRSTLVLAALLAGACERAAAPVAEVSTVAPVGSTGSDIADGAVAQCITAAVRGWVFPRPDGGGSVKVTYPFVLEPG